MAARTPAKAFLSRSEVARLFHPAGIEVILDVVSSAILLFDASRVNLVPVVDDGRLVGSQVVLTTHYRSRLRPRRLWRPLERCLARRLHRRILDGMRATLAVDAAKPHVGQGSS